MEMLLKAEQSKSGIGIGRVWRWGTGPVMISIESRNEGKWRLKEPSLATEG